jgi:hypothetical protein
MADKVHNADPIAAFGATFPERYTRVTLTDGTSISAAASEADKVDAAWSAYMDSAKMRDSIIVLDHLSGIRTRFQASDIARIDEVTVEGAEKQRQMNEVATRFWAHDSSKPWEREP